MVYNNITEAFEGLYSRISNEGIVYQDTKALFNQSFTILDTEDKITHTEFRAFNPKYAEREWSWYQSKNPDASEIAKYAPIWKKHMDNEKKVRSNYGHQLSRNNQLDKVIEKLKESPDTRQAVVSIYDGKEIGSYTNDTPCTIALQFQILDNKLETTAIMRSNDLWYGLPNDFFCFTMFGETVAKALDIPMGPYHHYAVNIHIYNPFLNKDS